VTFVRFHNVYDSIAQRDSNFSTKFVCKSESNCFPRLGEGGFSYAALHKLGELFGNYRVAKKGSLLLGATFILQDLQLLASFHALANDGLGRCQAARFSAGLCSIKSILNPTLAPL
jgi:hypothetical protein